MNTTQSIRIARPAAARNGKVSALGMVKALMASGVPAASIALVSQLTEAERTELGL